MKKIATLLLATILLFSGCKGVNAFDRFKSLESSARSASGAIFLNHDGERQFICSGTEIGLTPDGGGIFLTARHCVANPETHAINKNLTVSFSDNQAGPYYDAEPIALSLTDDIALLYLRNGSSIPMVRISDERKLSPGDPIFNVSFPLGTGKYTFHGEFLSSVFKVFIDGMPLEWLYALPMNLTIAPGSSGSGIFSQKQHALIAVAVGTTRNGGFNIAIPATRVLYLLHDLRDNTVEKYKQAFPEKEEDLLELLFGHRR